MNVEHELVKLFTRYINAFTQYDMALALSCYHMPCTLHTPDKIAYIENKEQFEQEFIDIFTILRHANISKINANKVSYQYCQKGSLDVCIDWLFYDDNNELFTDFTAFYHIANDENSNSIGKIVSVVSHEIQNSIELSHNIKIT